MHGCSHTYLFIQGLGAIAEESTLKLHGTWQTLEFVPSCCLRSMFFFLFRNPVRSLNCMLNAQLQKRRKENVRF
jgi:hypothetical protein